MENRMGMHCCCPGEGGGDVFTNPATKPTISYAGGLRRVWQYPDAEHDPNTGIYHSPVDYGDAQVAFPDDGSLIPAGGTLEHIETEGDVPALEPNEHYHFDRESVAIAGSDDIATNPTKVTLTFRGGFSPTLPGGGPVVYREWKTDLRISAWMKVTTSVSVIERADLGQSIVVPAADDVWTSDPNTQPVYTVDVTALVLAIQGQAGFVVGVHETILVVEGAMAREHVLEDDLFPNRVFLIKESAIRYDS